MFFLNVDDQNLVDNINYYHVKGSWEGQFIAQNDIPKNKNYFIEPFLLIDFSEMYHLKYKEVIKMYYGFRIYHYNFLESEEYLKYQKKSSQEKIAWSNFKIFDDLYHYSLKEKLTLFDFLKFRFQLTFNVNNNIKNECSQVISESESDQFFHPSRHKLYRFKQMPFTYNFQKPLYIPIKCFQDNKFNKIKWYLNFLNGKDTNDQRFQALEISFFWTNKRKIAFDISQNEHTLKFPYWFLITTKRDALLKITPVNFFQLKFVNKILPKYQNIIPFDSLWKITNQNLQMSKANFLLLNSFFTFDTLQKNFKRLQVWHQNDFPPYLLSRTNYLKFNHKWTGKMFKRQQKINPFDLTENLLLLDEETKKWLMNFKNFQIEYHHYFFDKSFYDQIKQQIIIDNNHTNTLLSDWKNGNYWLNIETVLPLENFLGFFEIKIGQKTFIENFKFQRIKITEIKNVPKNSLLDQEITYSFPVNVLKNIAKNYKIIWNLYLYKKTK